MSGSYIKTRVPGVAREVELKSKASLMAVDSEILELNRDFSRFVLPVLCVLLLFQVQAIGTSPPVLQIILTK